MNCGFWKKKPKTDAQPEHKRAHTQIEWRNLNGETFWTTRNLTWSEKKKTKSFLGYHASWQPHKITVQQIEVSESKDRNIGINLDGVPVVDYEGSTFSLPNQPSKQLMA